ncbi:MAG: type II toxin-antitoxin system prevent-host-death family antitoxin [Rhodocyclaceae bacterium]|nr:type II toxin-antitoxin system prevent-host-death family antitoxin [Rhodocyclaceae bacterium]
MITIGINEAKSSLGQLVQSAAAGEVVVLTRRGKPVAELRAPPAEIGQESAAQAIEALRKFRRTNRVGAFDIAELVAEGRRG